MADLSKTVPSNYRRFTPGSLTRVIAVAFGAIVSTPVLAQEDGFLFGSIALSQSTGNFGIANNQATQEQAEQAAVRACSNRAEDCQMATWFRNACGALAMSPDTSWGASWGATIDVAESEALRLCGEYSDQCTIKRSLCTGNVNITPNRGDRTRANVK